MFYQVCCAASKEVAGVEFGKRVISWLRVSSRVRCVLMAISHSCEISQKKKTQLRFLWSLNGDATYLIQDEMRAALYACMHHRASCQNIRTLFISLAL